MTSRKWGIYERFKKIPLRKYHKWDFVFIISTQYPPHQQQKILILQVLLLCIRDFYRSLTVLNNLFHLNFLYMGFSSLGKRVLKITYNIDLNYCNGYLTAIIRIIQID
jgi:hypothetical protein